MKLLFSEHAPDYSRYLYPYVVWAAPEPHETPADLYAAGFHPASPDLDLFTLCRHLRVVLPEFRESSENRRILRKGDGLGMELIPRSRYAFTEQRKTEWLRFAAARFGPGVMGPERLEALMRGRVITHVLSCTDPALGGEEVGAVLLYLEPTRMAHYYYAFYRLDHPCRSLGMYLMTSAVKSFQQAGYGHLYLGTCFSERALYKVQFRGLQYFHGSAWSDRVEDLRYLVRRDAGARHLLQEPEFLQGLGGMEALLRETRFRVPVGEGPKESKEPRDTAGTGSSQGCCGPGPSA